MHLACSCADAATREAPKTTNETTAQSILDLFCGVCRVPGTMSITFDGQQLIGFQQFVFCEEIDSGNPKVLQAFKISVSEANGTKGARGIQNKEKVLAARYPLKRPSASRNVGAGSAASADSAYEDVVIESASTDGVCRIAKEASGYVLLAKSVFSIVLPAGVTAYLGAGKEVISHYRPDQMKKLVLSSDVKPERTRCAVEQGLLWLSFLLLCRQHIRPRCTVAF